MRLIAAVAGALCLIGAAPRVQAALQLSPFATVGVMYDSNVFSRPSDEPPYAGEGNTRLSDTIERYLIGSTADFSWGLDKLSLNVQAARWKYERFGQLDHYESKFGGRYDWYASSIVSGDVGYTQQRIMAPLADTLAEQLEIETERQAYATARILVTPRWRFDVNPHWHEFESPLPGYPRFGFTERGGAASINYLGIQKLVAGLREDFLDGSYHDIVAATRYQQSTTGLTANYAITDFSSIDAQTGFTRRHSSLIDPQDIGAADVGAGGIVGTTSTFTGALGLQRRLSVKTSVGLKVFREIDSYVAGANSEIGTGGEGSVRWQPDVKLTFTARYRYTRQSIQGGLAIADFATRVDQVRHLEILAEYNLFHWLTLKPYYQRDTRGSSLHEATFSTNLVGVDVTAQLSVAP